MCCSVLDTGSTVYHFWIPAPRLHEDKLRGNDTSDSIVESFRRPCNSSKDGHLEQSPKDRGLACEHPTAIACSPQLTSPIRCHYNPCHN